ncbi:(2S)-3-sulfopropanediol dehydratase activating enzyme [Candidatus Epulonipiscium viviparus]|uniref:(2S)-3-sulfopropanediol dehydratase activating enzyme n=1 Tax=Candidatus Epulonipiscium viviparus TaxID=420336 RepID=UPI00016C0C55|nr:glycyl-radical enzyme activating protein [Candidatus Epulopiscium viviparus]
MQGIVFNIQHFTIHDGPGIRTELFLKGCPLRCEWCSNPEGLLPKLEVGVYKTKCIAKCEDCAKACPQGNILTFNRGKIQSIDRDKCTGCLECAKACPTEAIRQWGKIINIEECMKEILKDKGYYQRSGGGVTISGGEPLLQSEFVASVFRECQNEGIHTCVETSMYVTWENVAAVLPYADMVIADIKHMKADVHKKFTGVSNKLILENLKKLSQTGKEIILRIPVIPNVNEDADNVEATADFILNEMSNNIRTLQLLSFMHLGEEKYESLGMPYKNIDVNRTAFQKVVAEIAEYMNSRGIHCVVGTKEKE